MASHRARDTARSGLSLVELSIVLVILGLLVGGVLSGQALIKAAQLRTVTKEYNDIVISVQAFRDKYFYLPGDMPNATQFWKKQGGLGGYAGFCNTNSGAGFNATTQQGACDGNGDGRIELCSSLGTCEDAQFWQHLKMSQLLQVNVVASQGDEGIGIDFGGDKSLHNSRYQSGLWSTAFIPPASGQFVFVDPARTGNNVQVLAFGSSQGTTNPSLGPLLSTEDAWNIDSKVDDGKSTTGKIRVTYIGTGWDTCVSGTNYAISDTLQRCSIVWLNPF